MSVTDPIADMLTRIRNSATVGQPNVAMPHSKVKMEIAKILKEEGFLEGFEVADGEIPEPHWTQPGNPPLVGAAVRTGAVTPTRG